MDLSKFRAIGSLSSHRPNLKQLSEHYRGVAGLKIFYYMSFHSVSVIFIIFNKVIVLSSFLSDTNSCLVHGTLVALVSISLIPYFIIILASASYLLYFPLL